CRLRQMAKSSAKAARAAASPPPRKLPRRRPGKTASEMTGRAYVGVPAAAPYKKIVFFPSRNRRHEDP
ncbi:MAG TPA: hypothetical protein VG013_11235, partial [Gemmataceae bacterium]|nr:hypothetical protein [Gemmataceae bacterium]